MNDVYNVGLLHVKTTSLNGARFSNIFIEKRVPSYLQSLERSGLFSFDVLTHKRKNSRNTKLIFLRNTAIWTRLSHNFAPQS